VLAPLVEPHFSPCSFAYRPNLSYIQAVEKVADWRDLGYRWVLDADIVQYFDNIDHQILLVQLRQYIDHPGILCLIKAWISSGILSEQGLKLPKKGIPQGSVISRVRASQTLLTIGQFCDPLAVWAFEVIPVNQNSYEIFTFGRFLLNN
jgi:RNA-directed DNA polymerase